MGRDPDASRVALYYGCLHSGHHLNDPEFHSNIRTRYPDIFWTDAHLDGGLLRNGKHQDIYDGKVFATCGGRVVLWIVFVWWDRSGDSRSNSCSAFLVRGFDWPSRAEAFQYACEQWSQVVSRQKHPLVLQEK